MSDYVQNYNKGYYGIPTNLSERGLGYYQGKNDRENNNSGGGVNPIGVLVIALIVAAIAVPSLLIALISSMVMLWWVPRMIPSFPKLGFLKIYKATFFASCTYLTVLATSWLLISWFLPLVLSKIYLGADKISYFIFPLIAGIIVLLLFLSSLVAAVVLKRFLSDIAFFCENRKGYWRCVAIVASVIFPSMLIVDLFALWLGVTYQWL